MTILFLIGKEVALQVFKTLTILILADLVTAVFPSRDQKRAGVRRMVATQLDPGNHQAVIDPSCDDLPA